MFSRYFSKKVGLIGRLALAVASIIFLGATIVFYLQTQYSIEKETQHLEKALEENSVLVVPVLVNATVNKNFSTLHGLLDSQVKIRQDVYKLEWRYANGISIIATSDLAKSQVPSWILSIFKSSGDEERRFNAKRYGFDGELVFSISHISMQNEIWKQFKFLMRSVLLVPLLVTLAIILVLRSNLKMIHSLATISNAIRDGDFSARINPTGPPELKKAAIAFNDMASNTEQLLSRLEDSKKELSTQLSFTRQLLEAIPNPVYYLDLEGKLLGVNRAWEQFFGLKQKTVQGKNALDTFGYDRVFAQTLFESDMEIAKNKRQQFFPVLYSGQSGKSSQMMISKAVYANPEKSEAGIITCFVDVTELKNALQDKSVAEAASETKSRFLANMSHEMRTPLTAIIGLAESLYDKDRAPEKHDRSINTIVRAGKHLAQLINDLLDLSKVEAGKFEIENIPTGLIELISEVTEYISMHAKAKNLNFEVDYHFPLPEVFSTDSLRLKQILINLMNNAIKFTDDGHVKLNVKFDKHAGNLIFAVIDSGIGITEAQATRLFAPFSQADVSTTRKYGGTGLGLYLSKILVEKLGGTLDLRSEPGKGSCFTVNIPLTDIKDLSLLDKLPEQAINKQNNSIGLQQLTGNVLLVEDNIDNREFIEYLLHKVGLTVETALNGEEAVKLVSTQAFDLILMDMQMPVLDGLQATKLIRQSGIETTIIALTANASIEDRQQCFDAGFNDFLVKPIDQPVFYKTLCSYLAYSDSTHSPGSITSSLLLDSNKLSKLVARFVDGLPSVIEEISNAYEQNDKANLLARVHSLKGLGGNIGFKILTDISAAIEIHVEQGSDDKIGHEIELLRETCAKIQSGLA